MKNYWRRMDQLLFTIKNIQTLIKMFKIKNGMSPAIVSHIFFPWDGNYHNLTQQNDFLLPSIQTLYVGKTYLT